MLRQIPTPRSDLGARISGYRRPFLTSHVVTEETSSAHWLACPSTPAGGDLFGLPKHWVGATPAQIALAWLLARGDDLAPIPGTQRVARVEENAGRRRRGPQRRADRIAETELPIEASSSETPNRCWAACSVTPTEHSGGLPRRYRQGEGIAKGRIGYIHGVLDSKKLGVLDGKTLGWKAISYGAGALAGLVTQRVLETAWKRSRHVSPPVPADRGSSWIEALSWAIATGVGMGVTRLLAVRTAAVVWEAATHELPPQAAFYVDPVTS